MSTSRNKSRILLSANLITLLVAISFGLKTDAEVHEWNFDSDPNKEGIVLSGSNDAMWVETGGNDGGFLALTYPEPDQTGFVVFPPTDTGLVAGFKLEGDIRIGNSSSERPADGFSISLARDNGTDPLIEHLKANGGRISDQHFFSNAAESGTRTGIAVSFDTWAGNTLPDGPDMEGVLVRQDNVTLMRVGLPVRHGFCDDVNSLQTGPRNQAYWDNGGDPRAAESWSDLCWQPFRVTLDATSRLSISIKGSVIIDALQTEYFATQSRLILAARTGEGNEHTHFDNLRLTLNTTGEEYPGPTGFQFVEVETNRVLLSWDGPPSGELRAYEIEKNGELLDGYIVNSTTYEDVNITPGQTLSYRIRWLSIAGARSDYSKPIAITTPRKALNNLPPNITSFELRDDHIHIQFIGTLTHAKTISGPFVPVPDIESHYVERISSGIKFFKVIE